MRSKIEDELGRVQQKFNDQKINLMKEELVAKQEQKERELKASLEISFNKQLVSSARFGETNKNEDKSLDQEKGPLSIFFLLKDLKRWRDHNFEPVWGPEGIFLH